MRVDKKTHQPLVQRVFAQKQGCLVVVCGVKCVLRVMEVNPNVLGRPASFGTAIHKTHFKSMLYNVE